METVKFVSGYTYIGLDLSYDEIMNLFVCAKGRKEVVVECSDELKEVLRNVSEYSIPRFKDIEKYLKDNKIPYSVGDLKNCPIL